MYVVYILNIFLFVCILRYCVVYGMTYEPVSHPKVFEVYRTIINDYVETTGTEQTWYVNQSLSVLDCLSTTRLAYGQFWDKKLFIRSFLRGNKGTTVAGIIGFGIPPLQLLYLSSFWMKIDLDARLKEIVHECSHVSLNSKDLAYEWETKYKTLSVDEHRANADSIACRYMVERSKARLGSRKSSQEP